MQCWNPRGPGDRQPVPRPSPQSREGPSCRSPSASSGRGARGRRASGRQSGARQHARAAELHQRCRWYRATRHELQGFTAARRGVTGLKGDLHYSMVYYNILYYIPLYTIYHIYYILYTIYYILCTTVVLRKMLLCYAMLCSTIQCDTT